MSDLMLLGALRCQVDANDPIGIHQLLYRANQAADLIEKLQSENAKLRAELAKFDQGNLLPREGGYPHLQVKE